jgi:hypothetical protein
MATKFTVLRPDVEVYSFADMEIGDVFYDEGTRAHYMRLPKLYIKEHEYNAVQLSPTPAAGLAFFDLSRVVIPAYEVVIKM